MQRGTELLTAPFPTHAKLGSSSGSFPWETCPSSHPLLREGSTLAWKIPWMEEPGRLQSMGSLRSDTTERLHFHFSLSCIGEGNGNPLQCSCLENPRDGGAWWAAVYGVAQNQTQQKLLSSSSIADLLCCTAETNIIKQLHFNLKKTA